MSPWQICLSVNVISSLRMNACVCYVYGCVGVGVLCSLIALNIYQTGVTSIRWWKMAYRNRSDNHWKCNWSDTQQSILLLANTLLHFPSRTHMHTHTYACSLACMYTYTHPVTVCAVFIGGGGGGGEALGEGGQLENNSQFIWLIVADFFSLWYMLILFLTSKIPGITS